MPIRKTHPAEAKQSHQLIDCNEAQIELSGTPWKYRLFMVAAAHVDYGADEKWREPITVHAGDMADILEIESTKNLYRDLVRAADDLMKTTMKISEPGKNRRRKTIMDECEYNDGEASITLKFRGWFIPHISGLIKPFRKLQLQQNLAMPSSHGRRLHQLIYRWEFKHGTKRISLDDFREAMGVVGKYASIKDLKKKVLLPAVRDVNEHSDRTITWEQQKRGRTIEYLTFTITQKQKSEPIRPDTTNGADFLSAGGNFIDYARRVLPRCKLGQRPWTDAIKALREEIETKGIYRDMKTGEIIHRRGEPGA